MIVKGIVSQSILQQIRQALPQHGLHEGVENEFRTWRETVEGDRLLWVELDVNEDLAVYLYRTGFFERESPQRVTALECPHCGNADPQHMELQVEKTGWTHYPLLQDAHGALYADHIPTAEIFWSSARASTRLFCRRCHTAFADPGLPRLDTFESPPPSSQAL